MWTKFSLLLIFTILFSGCAVRSKNLKTVQNLPDGSSIKRYRKPSITIELSYLNKENKEKEKVEESIRLEEFKRLRNYFKKTKLFSRVVRWRKTSDILINVDLVKKGQENSIWRNITEVSLFIIPSFYKIEYELNATIFDDINKNVTEYTFSDSYYSIEHITMLPFALFSHPPNVDLSIRNNLYKTLLVQMVKDEIVRTKPKKRKSTKPLSKMSLKDFLKMMKSKGKIPNGKPPVKSPTDDSLPVGKPPAGSPTDDSLPVGKPPAGSPTDGSLPVGKPPAGSPAKSIP